MVTQVFEKVILQAKLFLAKLINNGFLLRNLKYLINTKKTCPINDTITVKHTYIQFKQTYPEISQINSNIKIYICKLKNNNRKKRRRIYPKLNFQLCKGQCKYCK